MANVGGLRPEQQASPQVKSKSGRVATQRDLSQRVGLSPTASPVDTYVRPQVPAQDQRLSQLAGALAELSPGLAKLGMDRQVDKKNDQEANKRYWMEKYREDHGSGAVTAAQVGKVYPELVPSVASSIAEGLGQLDAKDWLQGEIQEILQNDELRLDSAARQAAIAEIRDKARAQVGSNPFYGNGFFTQMDRSLGQFETNWMQETAKYHGEVQEDVFSMETAELLKAGGDLMDLDKRWHVKSSLAPRRRNELVVQTAAQLAVAEANPTILDQIPDRFLNAQSKETIARAKMSIESSMFTQFSQAKAVEQWRRSEDLRADKSGVLKRMVDGEIVAPAEFWRDPEMFEYVTKMNEQPTIDNTTSVRNMQHFRSRILRGATLGDFSVAFKGDSEFLGTFRGDTMVTEEALVDHIHGRGDLNKEQKQQLMGDIPNLMKGVNLIRDPDTTAYYDTFIGDDLKAFTATLSGDLLPFFNVNVHGMVRDSFYSTLQRSYMAHLEDNGSAPSRTEQDAMLREATETASKRLDYYQNLDNLRAAIEAKNAQQAASQQSTAIPTQSSSSPTASSGGSDGEPTDEELVRQYAN